MVPCSLCRRVSSSQTFRRIVEKRARCISEIASMGAEYPPEGLCLTCVSRYRKQVIKYGPAPFSWARYLAKRLLNTAVSPRRRIKKILKCIDCNTDFRPATRAKRCPSCAREYRLENSRISSTKWREEHHHERYWEKQSRLKREKTRVSMCLGCGVIEVRAPRLRCPECAKKRNRMNANRASRDCQRRARVKLRGDEIAMQAALEKRRTYQLRNREHINELRRRFFEEHPDCRNKRAEKLKIYYYKNREKNKSKRQAYYSAHANEICAKAKAARREVKRQKLLNAGAAEQGPSP